jgi:thiol-disulfide isomerase/thioredoxin
MRKLILHAGVAALLSSTAWSAGIVRADDARAIDGRWDATLIQNDTIIAFRLDIAGTGPTLKGTFYDGFQPYDGTTDASFDHNQLTLNVQHYLTTIKADLQDGKLHGGVDIQSRGQSAHYTFEAARHVESAAASGAPSIAGSWVIPLDTPSSKGEKAFRFIVEQKGAEVAASILRVDGDTGAYSGSYHDGHWVLSHFDGSRPGVIVVSPNSDGTLKILQQSTREEKATTTAASATDKPYGNDTVADGRYAPTLTAVRADVAKAKGLPEPENYETHTTVRDPQEKFTFNFKDVDGKYVSDDDPRFKGKVVLAIVTGTWCPNCHDEAQYLVQLDKAYRDKGLAIVALDFEEPEQQSGLERERAFVNKYGVKYTYLIAGAPSDMWEKIPQAVNLNTWPATLFIDRRGRVRSIHSGFASPASGEFNQQLQREFTTKIEHLLAEKATSAIASSQDASRSQNPLVFTQR